MKRGLWNKRIPTLAAFILLFISIWVTSYLIQTGVIFVGRATPDKTPRNVRIANITDTSFTVSFTTNGKTNSALTVEEAGKLSFLVLDDRNKKEGERNEFYSHYITVPNLNPQTSYNFTIIADGESYQDGDQKYFIRTASEISEAPPSQKPIKGKGLLPDGTAASDTIVELNIPSAQSITALTSNNGEFTIPTNSVRKENLKEFLVINSETLITIVLRRQEFSTTVQTLFKNTEALSSLTLAQNYDFSVLDETEFSTGSSVLRAPTPKIVPGTIRILSPRENESFVDTRPLFRGTALPNQKVKIKIESDAIVDEVVADRNGLWSYRPPTPIGTGQHKITIETVDSFGISKLLTQSFTVFASGSTVAQTATPSATPTTTPTPTPTVIVTPTPTLTPTQTPTIILTPTPSLAIVLTPTPTPIPTQIPVVTPAPPGNTTSLVLTAISVLLIFAGSALLFVL